MNYLKTYEAIITRYGSVRKPQDFYSERHHIIPRSVGGTDDALNLTYLPARVHFICHRLLCKIYPESSKLKFAFWAMCNQLNGDIQRNYKITSRAFQTAREQFSVANSKLHSGKKLSPEHLEIIRNHIKTNNPHKSGEESHLFGIPRKAEVVSKIRKTKLAHPERNANFKGYYVTPEGTFASAPQAAQNTAYKIDTIRKFCANPDKIVTKQMLVNPCLSQEHVGKRLRDLGWDFLPKPD